MDVDGPPPLYRELFYFPLFLPSRAGTSTSTYSRSAERKILVPSTLPALGLACSPPGSKVSARRLVPFCPFILTFPPLVSAAEEMVPAFFFSALLPPFCQCFSHESFFFMFLPKSGEVGGRFFTFKVFRLRIFLW